MTIEWNRNEIHSKLNGLMDRITHLAMQDNVISEDEQELIDVIKNHVFSFEGQIEEMVESHDDLPTIVEKVKSVFESGIEAAARQARKDGTITADELILIDRLAKSLRNEDVGSLLSS
jgi:hypothetical protein